MCDPKLAFGEDLEMVEGRRDLRKENEKRADGS